MPYVVAADGARLYYETAGRGEPLLLISGQANDHRAWLDVRDDFAAQRQVIVFDHRGTGASDKPAQPPYSTRGFAQDAISILDHLGIERAHAYGFSMGGRVGQWLAIDHPDRVGALVLGGTTPGNTHGAPRPKEIDDALKRADFDRFIDALVSPQWLAAHPHSPFIASATAAMRGELPVHARKLHYQASEAHDAWDQLPRIAAPTLVIHGSQDQVNVTANAALLAQRIPGAELCLVADGRHGYFVECREEASRVANAFLDRHPLLTAG